MQRPLRWAGKAAMVLALLVGFAALGSVLHVRSAVAQGALEVPVTCLNAQHLPWRTGDIPAEQIANLTAKQVRSFHLDYETSYSTSWHLRGVFAYAGTWLGYSAGERSNMAAQVVAHMPNFPPENQPQRPSAFESVTPA